MSKQASAGRWIGAVIVVLGTVAAGAYLAHIALHPTTSPTVVEPPASASIAMSAATDVGHSLRSPIHRHTR